MVLSVAPVAIWCGHLLGGENNRVVALGLSALSGLFLAFLLSQPESGRRLNRLTIAVPGVCFGLVILTASLSLMPWWSVGLPAPAWSLVDGSDFATIDRTTTLVEIAKLLGLGSMFVSAALLATGATQARIMLKTTLYLGAMAGVGMTISHSLGIGPWAGLGRLAGTFTSPNVAADVFGAMLVLACTWLAARLQRLRWSEASWPNRLTVTALPSALALIFGACLLMTASRAGIAVTLICLCALIVWNVLRSSHRLKAILVASAFGIAGLCLFAANVSSSLIDRIQPLSAGDHQRAMTVSTHWDAFVSSPLTGYGLGTFDAVNRQLLNSANYTELWKLNAAHNVFLQWLEEGGLLAAIPMFLCVIAVLAYPAFLLFTKTSKAWLVGAVLASFVFILHGWVDISLQSYSVAAMFALLLGIATGLARASR